MKPDTTGFHDACCLHVSSRGNVDLATANLSNGGVRPRSNISSGTPKRTGGPAASPCPQQAVRRDDLGGRAFRPDVGLGLICRSFEAFGSFSRGKHPLRGTNVWPDTIVGGARWFLSARHRDQNQNCRTKGRQFKACQDALLENEFEFEPSFNFPAIMGTWDESAVSTSCTLTDDALSR